MIKLFRTIRQNLLSESKTGGRYVKYAIGEIILVVIGILIALQVNNWNENQKIKKTEERFLTELNRALEMDLFDLKANINYSDTTIQSITILLNHLEKDLPYDDSLDVHFSNSSIFTNFIPNTSVYENLKSSGISIISNDSLRSGIVEYYDYFMGYIKMTESQVVTPHHNLSVRPTMIEKFNYSWFFKPASPNDFASLKDDLEYLSLLRTTKEITSFKRERSNDLLEQAQDLQRDIKAELEQ